MPLLINQSLSVHAPMYLTFLVFLVEEKTNYEDCACFYENTFSERRLIISMRLPDSVIGGFSIFIPHWMEEKLHNFLHM
jgi:hypothetical protein